MKIYLDNCALGRPEDEQKGLVKKQAEAVLDILEGVRQGKWQLVRSTLHEDEAGVAGRARPQRHARILQRLDLSTLPTVDSTDALGVYDDFRSAPRGKAPLLKPNDGFHLATAVFSGVAVMVTVDRHLYLWARAHRSLLRGLKVMRPGEFLAGFRDAKIIEQEEEEA
jgi:predicted nucleic acid-binding protein